MTLAIIKQTLVAFGADPLEMSSTERRNSLEFRRSVDDISVLHGRSDQKVLPAPVIIIQQTVVSLYPCRT